VSGEHAPKASEIETREPIAWVIAVRDDKIVRHRVFRTGQEALEAAGLEE
jgi:ketosteroid isomerase-like protein